MNSIKYLEQLQEIPCDKKEYDLKALIKTIESQKKESMAIEIGIATEIGLLYAFNHFNVNDSIQEGFASQYPNLAENQSLYEDLLAKGADTDIENLTSYIDRIKGKIYEIELVNQLNGQFDGYNFSISESATQPIWDIKGIDANGEEMLIQAKMGGETYALEVHERMLENPDVLFATSTEIQEKILEKSPELASQFINVMEVSNLQFTTQIAENVEQLLGNFGIDPPDGLGDLLPMLAEAKLVMKLLEVNSSVNKEYQYVNKSDMEKIKMIKAMVLISRYGITSVSAFCGAKAGAMVDLGTGGMLMGLGTLVGGLGGVIAGGMMGGNIEPRLYDLALDIMDYTRDDLFYLKNKITVDEIGREIQNTYFLLN